MEKRFGQLDSLRGIVAAIVMFAHISLVYKVTPLLITRLLTWSPLRVFINGGGAVMFFFVLSGFVLSLPFLNQNKVPYLPYIIKRIFRIYLPYILAICVAFSLALLVSGNIKSVSLFLNGVWDAKPIGKYLLEHLTLIGNIHSNAYDPVIWSLIHEMRISLIFPLIVLLVKRTKLKTTISICLAMAMVGGLNNKFHFEISNGYATTYFDTLRMIPVFVTGVLIAKHRLKIISFYKSLTLITKILLFVFSLVIYNFSEVLFPFIINHGLLNASFLFKEIGNGMVDINISQYGEMLGAAGLILFALGSNRVERFLLKGPFVFLGRISFSLYLYHFIVILLLVHLFYRSIPLTLILFASIFLSIGVAKLAWLFVEVPCINIGKDLSRRLVEVKRRKYAKSA
ncbi:acyltransferase [Pullulanibacillus sp. KACC 23026]|uniref:acyltransferase family protein n=1 Tax=Pullulanibacillus sp. KACC 23026 TaxID=3028315 RepID=UPI0023AF1595|nr:acyltransferase [Pullulanibacillus sp. KACC 23026]WEG11497.1 acyltransferase [Pullulanibacillus sp. KACC 23026]